MTRLTRETKETTVGISVALEGGTSAIATGEPFLDHMMRTLAHYAGWGLEIHARGDLRHHLVEDVAIALGDAVRAAAPAARARFASVTIPMDEALVECTLDAGERFYYAGPLPSSLYDHWMRSFAERAGLTLHLRVHRGRDRHHIVEAAFKALGIALATALALRASIQSTKGVVVATAGGGA
jgi:imidazoleglycerol-phosphate dehydratase